MPTVIVRLSPLERTADNSGTGFAGSCANLFNVTITQLCHEFLPVPQPMLVTVESKARSWWVTDICACYGSIQRELLHHWNRDKLFILFSKELKRCAVLLPPMICVELLRKPHVIVEVHGGEYFGIGI
jgi:hypothetical protein